MVVSITARLILALCLINSVNLFYPQVYAQGSKLNSSSVGNILRLNGTVLIGGIPAKEEQELKEGDTLRTGKSSFVRIEFRDRTFVNLGSETEFHVKSYRLVKGKRKNNLKVLKGKIRVWVNQFADPGEEINVNAQQIALGVRGTEFLVNAYSFGGAPSSDVLLVKGSLKASGAGFNAFTMEPGQFFNSQDLLRNGMKALKSLSKEALLKVKDSMDTFIPELQTPNGLLNLSASTLGAVSGIAVGAASGLLGSSDTKERPAPKPLVENVTEKKKQIEEPKIGKRVKKNTELKGVIDFSYDLKKEKWDIRDAVLNREKNKKENKCFYFFYKQLPGAGEPERFRRERDCDEFEYDL